MAFFAADENFLELTVNKTNANRQNGMNIGPIKFNMTTRNSNLAQQEKDGLSEFFQETHESRPISYHKFPNYSIIEADPKTTGISKLLKIDFVNSKISEIDHIEFTKFLTIKNKITKKYCFFLGFMTIMKHDFLVFVDESHAVTDINGAEIFKIDSLFFMMTHRFNAGELKKKKVRAKMDEITTMFSKYGYYSYKIRLSSRLGGGPNSMNTKGIFEFRRRPEYVANRDLMIDLQNSNLEAFQKDVILGYIATKSYEFKQGNDKKLVQTILISRRMLPKVNYKGDLNGINPVGKSSKYLEIETLFSDGYNVYSHILVKSSLSMSAEALFGVEVSSGLNFDVAENQNKIFKNHFEYLKKNYGATLIINMMNLNQPDQKSFVDEIEGILQRNMTGPVRYKFFNLADPENLAKKDDFLSKSTDYFRDFNSLDQSQNQPGSPQEPQLLAHSSPEAQNQPKKSTSDEADSVSKILKLFKEVLAVDDSFCFRVFDSSGRLSKDQKGVMRVSCPDLVGFSDLFVLISFYAHLYKIGYNGMKTLDDFFEDLKTTAGETIVATRHLFIDYSEYSSRLLHGVSSQFSNALRQEMPLRMNDLKESIDITNLKSGVYKSVNSVLNLILGEQTGIIGAGVFDSFHQFAANDAEYHTYKKLRMQMYTYNVAGMKPPSYKNILDMFRNVEHDQPELVVVGLQEIFAMKSKNIGKLLLSSNKESTRWKFLLTQCLNSVGTYNLVEEQAMQGVYCAIFASPEVAAYIKGVTIDEVKLGILNIGNKGGVVISINIFETKLKFCACHLASGQSDANLQERQTQMQQIHDAAFQAESNAYRFWLGDFNFRLNLKYDAVMLNLLEYDQLQKTGFHRKKQQILDELLKSEQLCFSITTNPILIPFKETRITFPPTYKMEEYHDSYKQKKTRVPSWTDRIIYSLPQDGYINVIKYSRTETKGSDHRPVYLLAEIKIKVINKQKLRLNMVNGVI